MAELWGNIEFYDELVDDIDGDLWSNYSVLSKSYKFNLSINSNITSLYSLAMNLTK